MHYDCSRAHRLPPSARLAVPTPRSFIRSCLCTYSFSTGRSSDCRIVGRKGTCQSVQMHRADKSSHPKNISNLPWTHRDSRRRIALASSDEAEDRFATFNAKMLTSGAKRGGRKRDIECSYKAVFALALHFLRSTAAIAYGPSISGVHLPL